MSLRYHVGIDLGTSNTALAYAALGADRVELLQIDQLLAPGQLGARPLLPSVRYHPAPGEIDPAGLQLPWPAGQQPGDQAPAVLGRLALDLGARVPGRLVTSAKSWLSHDGVDRLAPILPWGGDDSVPRISPVAASASYLAHVRAAWLRRFPDAPLEDQQIVLTVPASFDEGARALTLEAARLAGLARVRLLEEPQAAVYDWLHRHRDTLAEALAGTRLLMVCDIGGGTTDLTLIRVAMRDGVPELTRIGVGDHLMLGGDNMDLALARLLESRLAGGEDRLSAARLSQLTARCRTAKERLLALDAPGAVTVTLLGGGAKLIGGARSVELSRDEVLHLVLDGFLPKVAADAPLQRRRGAIVEFGLPYPADAAITRHIAAFLAMHAQIAREALGGSGDAEHGTSLPLPDTLLLNGGVFRAEALAERLQQVLESWRGKPLRRLHNADPDAAVARGAVAYALVRDGAGAHIGGGSARSYFLLLDDAREPVRGVCILPRGSVEGNEIRLPERSFELRLGQPVSFRLASSVADTEYRPGDLAELGEREFVRLPPLATVVRHPGGTSRKAVRVEVIAAMTELGTLQLNCVSDEGQRWLLEFQLRGAAAAARHEAPAATLPPRFVEAEQAIDGIFGSRTQAPGTKEVRRLRNRLEQLLGKREQWEVALLRALCDLLLQRAARRRRSPEHERLWLNLVGFCLRPGLGDALDEWRIGQLCPLLGQGLAYLGESQNWSEWWTLWRRVAAGLPADFQETLVGEFGPWLEGKGVRQSGSQASAIAGSRDDMLRLLASLERLPAEFKIEAGDWLLGQLGASAAGGPGWWALGRLGARQPLYGSAHQVVPPEAAARWLEALLALDWKAIGQAAFAASQIAALTEDRARDLPEALRETVAARLEAINASASWISQVRLAVGLDKADRRHAFGEALPPGLTLLS